MRIIVILLFPVIGRWKSKYFQNLHFLNLIKLLYSFFVCFLWTPCSPSLILNLIRSIVRFQISSLRYSVSVTSFSHTRYPENNFLKAYTQNHGFPSTPCTKKFGNVSYEHNFKLKHFDRQSHTAYPSFPFISHHLNFDVNIMIFLVIFGVING